MKDVEQIPPRPPSGRQEKRLGTSLSDHTFNGSVKRTVLPAGRSLPNSPVSKVPSGRTIP